MALIYSAIPASKRPTLAAHGRKAYLTDGQLKPQVWDGMGATMGDAGIVGPSREVGAWAPAPPTIAAGPGVTVGTHLYRYRYKDSRTGYVSNPSNVFSFTWTFSAFDGTFPVSTTGATNVIRSTDPKADTLVLESTLAGGTVFFVCSEQPMTSGTVAVTGSDRVLVSKLLPWPDDGHLPPPVTAHAFSYRGRMWYYGQVVHNTGTVATNGTTAVVGTSTAWSTSMGTNPVGPSQRTRRMIRFGSDATAYEIASVTDATNLVLAVARPITASGVAYVIYSLEQSRLWFSLAGYPEAVPLENFVDGPNLEPTRSAIGVLNGILLCGLSTMSYYRYTTTPAEDGSLRQASWDRGSVGHHVTLNVDEVVYTLDRRGMTSWSGDAPIPISRPIESTVARINYVVENTFHACYYPRSREVRWYVALDADTTPGHYLAWNVQRRTWSIGELEVKITSSALVQTVTGTRPLVGDANGHVWLDDAGTTGGSDANPRGTAATGCTTTVIDFSDLAALPATGVGLTGVTLYFERLNETRVISANTATQATVSVAFSSAPLVGDVLWLGRIKAKLKTKAFVFDAKEKHKGRFVHVWFTPLAVQRFARVRVYRDWQTTAMSWSEAQWRRSGTPPRGTLYPDPADALGGGTDWRIDLSLADGVARIPLGDESVRVTEVEVEVFQADSRVNLLGVTVDADPIAALV